MDYSNHFHVLIYLVLITTWLDIYCYYDLHFIDEEIKTHKCQVVCPVSRSRLELAFKSRYPAGKAHTSNL